MKLRYALAAVILAACVSVSQAQDNLTAFAGLACDTPGHVSEVQKQAERLGSINDALDRINQSEGRKVCAVIAFMGIKHGEAFQIVDKYGKLSVLEVMAVGLITRGGYVPLNTPATVYVPVRIEISTGI